VLLEAEAGVVVTDCLWIMKKCLAIQRGLIPKETVLKGASADLWWEVWQVLSSRAGWSFQWLPSHRSESEAMAAGRMLEDWLGTGKADDVAKAHAKAMDISPQLLTEWAENQAAMEAVWRLIAESQVAHLAGRPRRQDGTAVKSRTWKVPTCGQAAAYAGGLACSSRCCRCRRWPPQRCNQRQAVGFEAGPNPRPMKGQLCNL
jgi:hypothetical protein